MTTRDSIVQAADVLFYERGFEHTSFADIAEAIQISRGNFYYHFRTKDEILEAVITARMARTQDMLAQWDVEGAGPQQRIQLFAEILVRNQAKIMKHGCPVGSLCMELAKIGHAAQDGANAVMELFRSWLCQQFKLLGCKNDADSLALHLLVRTQGVATLAQVLRDDRFVQYEVHQIMDWVRACAPATKRRLG